MKATDYIYYFIVFCALAGVGIWMLTDGNYVFGTLVTLTAYYHAYRVIKINNKKNDS